MAPRTVERVGHHRRERWPSLPNRDCGLPAVIVASLAMEPRVSAVISYLSAFESLLLDQEAQPNSQAVPGRWKA
jgi:hypothetical protein